MGCREDLEAYLRERKVPFHTQQHAVVYTAQEVAESEHISGKGMVKVVIALADGKMIMLALPASHNVNFAKAAQALAMHEVRLAHESELSAVFPDCAVGAMRRPCAGRGRNHRLSVGDPHGHDLDEIRGLRGTGESDRL